jgi:hypothetical protein
MNIAMRLPSAAALALGAAAGRHASMVAQVNRT